MTRLTEKRKQLEPAQVQQRQVIDDPDKDMGFSDQWLYSVGDGDINTQKRIVAESFDIPVSAVGMSDKGMTYTKDGKTYLVNPSDFMSKAGEYTAAALSKPGAMVGAIAGTPLGPAGIAGGAAVGDAFQTSIEKAAGFRDRSLLEQGVSATQEASMALGGEALARGGKALIQGGKNIGNSMGWIDTPVADDVAKGFDLKTKAKAYGIPLTPAEAMDDRTMLNKQQILRDAPNAASGRLDDFLDTRIPEIEKAVQNNVGDKSVHDSYRATLNKLQSRRDGMVTDRTNKSTPYYRAANPTIADIKPVVDYLQQRLNKTQNTKIGASLKRVQRGLSKMDGKELVTKDILEELHMSRMDLDDLISAEIRKGKSSNVRELTMARDRLTGALEAVSEDYRTANGIYSELTEQINTFDKGLAGDLLAKTDKSSPNLGKLAFSPESSPEAVAQARRAVGNDDVFGSMVKGHLKARFNKLNDSAIGGTANIGGLFRKDVFGSEHKRSLLRAALPEEQYQALADLMDVLEATGRAFKSNSTTAEKQQLQAQMSELPIVGDLNPNARMKGIRFDSTSDRMADLITNDYSQYELSQIAKKLRGAKSMSEIKSLLSQESGLLGFNAISGSED